MHKHPSMSSVLQPTEEAIKSFAGSSLQSVMSEWFRYRVRYFSIVWTSLNVAAS